MLKTIDQELEGLLIDLFLAFGKNPKYEKVRMSMYGKYLLKNYNPLEIPVIAEVCEVLIQTRTFLPSVNEIIEAYDFLLWCKSAGYDKEQRKKCYREFISDVPNNTMKGTYKAAKILKLMT